MHLRNQLSLTFIAIVSPVLLLLLANFYYFFALDKQNDFLIKIKNKGITMTHLLLEKQPINESLLRRIDEESYAAYSDRRVAVFDKKNHLLYDSGEIDKRDKSVPDFQITPELLAQITQHHEVPIDDGRRLGVGLPIHYQGYDYKVVSYAVDDYGKKKIQEAILLSGGSFVFIFLLVILLSQLFANRTIKPIANMIQQIDQITVSNMETRLTTTDNDDELDQLAHTFNQMLDRISAFELQRSFVSNASHELRTPLTLITNQIEVALIKTRTIDEYEQILRSILEDINRLNLLSNGLLELAQFDVEQINVTWASVNLDDVLYEAVGRVLQKHPTYKITFTTESADEGLPSVMVKGEKSLLETAFINLIENGCKFSADKYSELLIVARDTTVQVAVKDYGIGIAEAELDYVFQPFYRATNAKSVKGNGIGLSLTQKIIKLHGGMIDVQSSLGHGTTFTVTLPRIVAAGLADGTETSRVVMANGLPFS